MEAGYEKNGYTIEVSQGGFYILYKDEVICSEYYESTEAVDDAELESKGRLRIIAMPDGPVSTMYEILLKNDTNGVRCLVDGSVVHSTETLNENIIDFESAADSEF